MKKTATITLLLIAFSANCQLSLNVQSQLDKATDFAFTAQIVQQAGKVNHTLEAGMIQSKFYISAGAGFVIGNKQVGINPNLMLTTYRADDIKAGLTAYRYLGKVGIILSYNRLYLNQIDTFGFGLTFKLE